MENIRGPKALNTANFAKSVQNFVTLVAGLACSGALQAQSLDLSKLSNWNYDGSPAEIKKDRGCGIRAGRLAKDFMGHFSMEIDILTHPKEREAGERRRLRLKPPISLKAPDACETKKGTCTYDSFQLMRLDGKAEVYSLTLVTSIKDPEEILEAYLSHAGEFTGERRLVWECRRFARTRK